MNRKIVLQSCIGNALEYYDFTLYGYLLPILAREFFPIQNTFLSTIAILATYAVGFLFRPVGSIIFGFLGDKYGRKLSLTISLFVMALSSGTLGLVPTYEQIGLISPFLVIFARICQGICMSGECAGALIFAMEATEKSNLASVGALISASTFIGCFLAIIALIILLSGVFPEWSWRVCFLLGSLVGIVGLYIRFHLPESPEFEKFFNKIERISSLDIIKKQYKKLLIAIALIAVCGVAAIFPTIYLNMFLTKSLGYTLRSSLMILAYGMFISFLTSIIYSLYLKKFQPAKIAFYSNIIYIFILPVYLYALETHHFPLILFMQFNICVVSATLWSASSVIIFALFPTNIKYFSIALSDSLGKAIFVGSTPMILWWAQSISILLIELYYLLFFFQLFFAFLYIKRFTKNKYV